MASHFRPYEGDKPFLFVSYAHRDSDSVVDTIRVLHDRLWRVWYDEGIPAGGDWSFNIGRHMDGCMAVLLFLSENTMASPNCTSEARTAFQLGRPIICVRMRGCEPRGEWRDFLANASYVDEAPTPREQADAICASPLMTDDLLGTVEERRQTGHANAGRSGWVFAVAVAALLLAGSLGLLGAVVTGQLGSHTQQEPAIEPAEEPTREEVDLSQYGDLFERHMSFPDSQQERAVRAALGQRAGEVPSKRLLDITELYFCGNLTPTSLDAVTFDDDGSCLVNGVRATQGQIGDLSLIASMPYLERLALVYQPLEDVSDLSGLQLLRELSLAGCPVSDVAQLAGLPSLEVLHLEHSSVRDLTSLSDLPALATVTVSADMVPLVLDPTARYRVVLVR